MTKPHFTAEEDEVIRAFYPDGGSAACEAAGLKRTRRSITARAGRIGVKLNPGVRKRMQMAGLEAAWQEKEKLTEKGETLAVKGWGGI